MLKNRESADVNTSAPYVSAEEWADFLQKVLETTATAYCMLKYRKAVRSDWKEDTFTLQIVKYMKQIIQNCKSALCAELQQYIYTSKMMAADESPEKAVKIDIKIWHRNWYNEDDIYFAWECKLIVDKARESTHRRLVPEYITNGIIRFLDTHWRYAQAVNDAGMLGYVLYGEVSSIVEAINQEMLAIPRRPESSAKDFRTVQSLHAARELSSSDQLKRCNPSPIDTSIFYESHHHRSFCKRDIRLYHFFLTFDFTDLG